MRRCVLKGEGGNFARYSWYLISIFFLCLLPLQLMAQSPKGVGVLGEGALTCNPRIQLTAQGSPFFLNDRIHILADIGAASIQGGSQILIDEFKYALDCAQGQTIRSCVAEGNFVTLDDLNITTNCVDQGGNPVDWQVSESNIRTFSPTSNLPVVVGANSTCRVEFDVTIHELDGVDNILRELLGWTSSDAACDNGLPAAATSSVNIVIQECGVDLGKEVSVDGGATWHDANSPDVAPYLAIGEEARYRLRVENTGTVGFVQPISIVDAALGISTTIPALAAGASTVVDGGVIPQLNVPGRCQSVGSLENVSSAQAACRTGASPVSDSADDNAWVNCISPAEIQILKEISIDGGATWHDANSAGTAPAVDYPSGADYRISVSNPGPTNLSDVVVNDATLGIVDFAIGNLNAGASVVLTSAQIPALGVAERCDSTGTFPNTATADGNSALTGDAVPQSSDPAYLVCAASPEIDVLKEISVDGGATWHDANSAGTAPVADFPSGADYRITVSNPGPTDLVNVVVNDATLGIANHAVGSLAAGANVVLTSGTIPALAVAEVCDSAGTFTNTATADGESADTGTPAPQASDPANLVCVEGASVEILKEISIDGGASWHDANSAGTAPVVEFPSGADYRITVSNPGPTDLVNVVVNDATLGIANHAVGSLAAGANVVLTSGTIPALAVAEVCDSAGTYTNIATADGESADTGTPAPQASDPANLVCVDPPAINVLKEISIDGGATWHDANSAGTAPVVEFPSGADYRITASNPGPTNLVNVVVNDATLGISNHAVGSIAAGANVVLTSGTIPALSVQEVCDAAGTFVNTATADGDSEDTGTSAPQASDPATLVCTDGSSVGILKEISVDGGATWHDANDAGTAPVVDFPSGAEYRITVSNTGLVDLVNVVVNDSTLGISDYAVGDLAVGANVVLTSGSIPVLDVAEVCDAAGTFVNTATADGESAETGTPAPQASDPATLVCVDPPEVLVLKEISVDGGDTWHDANNPGTAPVVTFPSGAEYRITVHNPGPVNLENVVVNDAELGISGYVVGNLAAGATVVLTSSEISELSVNEVCDASGDYVNTATADGSSEDTGTSAPQASDPAVLVCIGTPSIVLTKEISIDDGDTWHDADDLNTAVIAVFPSPALYRLTVTNNGTSPLTGVVVNDPDLNIVDYPVGNLDIGQTVILTSGEIPELSVSERCGERGTFVNNATASGESAEDQSGVNDSDPAYLVCVGEPHISIVKEISVDDGVTWYDDAPPPQLFPSDAWYRISVSNDGTAPLEDVEVSDLTLGIVDYFVGNLAVGETVVLTEAEIPELYVEDRCTNGGQFMNTASVAGASADFPYEEVNDSDMANLECLGDPMVEIDKEISVDGGINYVDADDINTAAIAVAPADVYYRIILRNIGLVTLTNILVNDPVLGIFDYPVVDLPAGDDITIDSGDLPLLFVEDRCTGVGTFLNTASVSAESSDGTSTNDSDPAWLSCVGTPDIQIVKEISTNGGIHWFDDVSTAELPPANALYRLRVTNTGTSDLDDVVVSDPTLGIFDYYIGLLGIGESVLLTQADIPALSTTNRCIQAGTYVNTSSTNGVSLDFPFESVNDSDPATLVCIQFQDVCGHGKPKRLRLQYDADSDSNHSQTSSEVIISPPNAVFPASVYIEAFGHRGELLSTHSNVPPGYVFDLEGPQNKIPPRVSFKIYTSQGGTLIQTVQFHSSCSQPLEAGDEFGAITVVAGFQ